MGETIILFAVFLYLTPAGIALIRGHRNLGAIIVLNVMLGWTFIGWVAALVWAVSNS